MPRPKRKLSDSAQPGQAEQAGQAAQGQPPQQEQPQQQQQQQQPQQQPQQPEVEVKESKVQPSELPQPPVQPSAQPQGQKGEKDEWEEVSTRLAEEVASGTFSAVDATARRIAPPLEGPFRDVAEKAVQYAAEIDRLTRQALATARFLMDVQSMLSGSPSPAPQPPAQAQPQPAQAAQAAAAAAAAAPAAAAVGVATPDQVKGLLDAFATLVESMDSLRRTMIERLKSLGIDARDLYVRRDEVEKMLERCREETIREATDEARLKATTELIKHSIDRVVQLFEPLIRQGAQQALGPIVGAQPQPQPAAELAPALATAASAALAAAAQAAQGQAQQQQQEQRQEQPRQAEAEQGRRKVQGVLIVPREEGAAGG